MSFPTCGVIVGLLPVQNDKGRASFHCYHGDVGGRRPGRGCHIGLATLVFGEVVEGGGDGAWLVLFLSCLVNNMRRCGRRQIFISHDSLSLILSSFRLFNKLLTYITLLPHGVKVRGRL